MQRASLNLIKDLKKQKRENSSLLFLDNPKIIKDALYQGHKAILALTTDSKFCFKGVEEEKIFLTDSATISSLSDVKTPQGVCVMIEYTQNMVKKPSGNFLVLDGLQDPGNVGTLIRSALATGFNEVYLIDSVKETNSKMIRSCAGANFNVKLYSMSREEFIKFARIWKVDLFKADMKGENVFTFKNKGQMGVVIGNEGNGVSKELSEVCKASISIPMKEGIESLNAGVSGSIIMYEIAKDTFK